MTTVSHSQEINEGSALNSNRYDLIVLGGGPAGTCGANTAAYFGKRVAVIEQAPHLGGAGINSGTIPSKTLRESALALSGLRSRNLHGVDLSLRRNATVADLMHHAQYVTTCERKRVESNLAKNRVEYFTGKARFVDPHTLNVTHADGSERLFYGDIILIATGSVPTRPPEFPFEDDRVHDSDELLEIKTLPDRLVIIGAGVIGCEYACTFAAMGVEVHLVDGRDTLLPFLDREVSAILMDVMAKSINFHWNERVTKCDASDATTVRVTLTSGDVLECDGLLVCAGRTSRTADLNLDLAGVTLGKRGVIPVTSRYRTTDVAHIYAAGDVIGPPALAATSMEQARIAMCEAFGVLGKADMSPVLPIGIYTIPEAAMAGETEEALREKGIEYVVGRSRYSDHPRGQIIGEQDGFLKLLFRRGDMKLLGVHVLGEQATEIVHLGLLAMVMDGGAEAFNRICFNYPTLGDLYKFATYDALITEGAIHG